MNQSEVMQSIVVQGTLLESDTKYYVELLDSDTISVEYSDPVKRTISSVFKMCLDGSIDPWNIDLKAFVEIFSGMVDENFRDFGAAGYLIYQAWKILNRKSLESLEKRLVTEDFEEESQDAPEIIRFHDPLEISVREPVKHQEQRKVFLVELLDAMRDAYRIPVVQRKRKEIEEPEHLSTVIEGIVHELHAEEPETEIRRVYEILLSLPDSVYLEDVWNTGDFSRAAFFVYCMFLMREKKIRLQQNVPYGLIKIEKPL